MKNNILYLCFIFGFVACTTPFQSFGEFSRDQLENSTHNNWFLENYNAYPLNKALVSQIHSLFDDIEVTIYMGTWCEDSQREVPGFFKIIDALEANDQVQPIVGLNEDKVSHDGSAEQAGVTNVPTFILSKDGQEINRIVEFPIISLEQDILDILLDKGYKHAYDF
jgi:thiol-disulfide isomerase/thioredoxin